jgi:hypothetical protein
MTSMKTAAAALALVLAALPAVAGAACLERTDMHALQAASLQQRLMVAGFTCHDARAYNSFVLSHRGELQKSDASLLAFFKHGHGGEAAYHTYKTHLANASALQSSRDDGFCGDVGQLFDTASTGGSLDAVLDTMPTTDTGYTPCYMASVQPSRSQRVVRTASVSPRVPETRNYRQEERRPVYGQRDSYDRADDRDRNYAWNDRDDDDAYERRDHGWYRDPRDDDRYDDRYDDRARWRDRYDDRDGPYDGPDDDSNW